MPFFFFNVFLCFILVLDIAPAPTIKWSREMAALGCLDSVASGVVKRQAPLLQAKHPTNYAPLAPFSTILHPFPLPWK